MQKRNHTTTLQGILNLLLDLKSQILVAPEIILHFKKAILFIRSRVLSFFFQKSLVEYEKFLFIYFSIYVYYLKIIADWDPFFELCVR